MSSVEKLSEYPLFSVEEVAKMCDREVADVQEWCRNGLDSKSDRIFLDALLKFIDDEHIEVDETSPLLAAGREWFEENGGYIAGRIREGLDYGRVA